MQSYPNEEMDQKNYDYIEHWWKNTTQVNYNYPLPKLFISYHLQMLFFHALVYIKVCISNLSMNVFLHLL